jgi:hypothetical protein
MYGVPKQTVNSAITIKFIVDSSKIENSGTNVDFAIFKIVW